MCLTKPFTAALLFICAGTLPLISAPTTPPAGKVEEMRNWTSKEKKTITARLVKVVKETVKGKQVLQVTFKLKTGRKVTFPVTRLSDANQKELTAWLRKNPTGVAPPRAPYSWPSRYSGVGSPEVTYVKYDTKRKAHLYRTAHFDFYMETKLSKTTVSRCVAVFDSIVEAIDTLPMAMDTIPKGDRPRYQTILVSSREKYMQMGGIPNSAGFFSPGKNLTVIPLESLGIVKKGNKWVFDGKRRTFTTLIHELTHHATQHWWGMPPWFEEGLAQYMSAMPYQSGRFLFTNPGNAVASSARKYKKYVGGEAVMPKGVFQMIHLKRMFATTRQQWNGAMSNRTISARNYTGAMILAYYFMHEDGAGDGHHIIQWMHSLRAANLARNRGAAEKLLKKHLLRDRTYEQLEEEIKVAMRKKGLRLTFAN